MPKAEVMLISGTSRGIGLHLGETYCARGWRVVGCSRGSSPLAHANYIHVTTDITCEEQVRALVRRVRTEFGRLDVVVASAGIASMNLAVLTPPESFKKIFSVNVFGTLLLCREAIKLMQPRRCGRIVTLGSVAVPLLLEGESAYAASKAAIEVFTKVLARETAAQGITCNVVAPGPVRTDLTRGLGEARIARLLERVPLGRFTTLDDIVNAVDFFIRPESDGVTGQVLYLGGVS